MNGKKIKVSIYGVFKQHIKSHKFYILVEITKGKKLPISPIFEGKNYLQHISTQLQGKRCEIQRIRCEKGSHELKIPVHAIS